MKTKKNVFFLITRDLDIYCQESLIDKFYQDSNFTTNVLMYHLKDSFFTKDIYDYIKNKKWNIKIFSMNLFSRDEFDFLFISNPWIENLNNFKEKNLNIVYIPYGCSISGEPYSEQLQYGNTIHNMAWRILTISDYHKLQYKKLCENYSFNKIINLKKTPKFDFVIEKKDKYIRTNNKFTILWCIHYTVVKHPHCERQFSSFFNYAETIFKFVKHKDVNLIISPHPRLLSPNKVDKNYTYILELFSKLPNVEILTGADFHCNRFFKSDVMIADLTTTALDYSVTLKPIISLFSETSAKLNDFGNNFFDTMTYKSSSNKELVENLIKLMKGLDAMKEQRERNLTGENGLFDISKNVYSAILHEINK